jgi:hypothetical protein
VVVVVAAVVVVEVAESVDEVSLPSTLRMRT